MFLDIRTLVFNLLIFAFVFAGGLCLLQRGQPRVRGLYWWSLANALAGLGFLFTALRDFIPDMLSVVAANALLLVGLCCFHEGVARLRGYTWHYWWMLPILLVIMVPLLVYYTYYDPDVGARIIVQMICSKLPTCHTVWMLVRKVPRRLRPSYWFTASGFILVALMSSMRAVHAFFNPPTDLMSAGPAQAMAFLSLFLLLVIASFGCLWMVAAHLNNQLEVQARTDSLTGTLNRFALDECLTREMARVQRDRQPLSLLLFDLDHFKDLNDRMGHLHGDEALKTVARVTQQELRASDLLARYGGEEFLVMLPGADKEGAVAIAERLRNRLEAEAIDAGRGNILTSSYGVATFPEDGEEGEALIARADARLYAAKQAGRNSVVSSNLPQPTPIKAGVTLFPIEPLPAA